MSSRFQQKRRFLVGILVLVLIISVGLNLYDHLIVLPQMQATINNMRVQALNAWLSKMELVKNLLKQAKTNIDVKDAQVHTSWAKLFEDILSNGINIYEPNKELYYWISKVANYLDMALFRIYTGNQTGAIIERNLDQNVLKMMENVTANMENLVSKPAVMRTTPLNGVEPTQRLREEDVLTDVLNYLEQIYQVSIVIYNYYK